MVDVVAVSSVRLLHGPYSVVRVYLIMVMVYSKGRDAASSTLRRRPAIRAGPLFAGREGFCSQCSRLLFVSLFIFPRSHTHKIDITTPTLHPYRSYPGIGGVSVQI